jgi:hypothetical protein
VSAEAGRTAVSSAVVTAAVNATMVIVLDLCMLVLLSCWLSSTGLTVDLPASRPRRASVPIYAWD